MATVENPMSEEKSPADTATYLLRRSSYRALASLTCTFDDGVLTLRGRLPSFYLKQVAQNAVKQIPGVTRLDNQIEVVGQ